MVVEDLSIILRVKLAPPPQVFQTTDSFLFYIESLHVFYILFNLKNLFTNEMFFVPAERCDFFYLTQRDI